MDDDVARKNPPSAASGALAFGPANRPPDHWLGRVLRPRELLDHARYATAVPDEALSPWVERYWSVTWDLGPGERYRATTVSEPAVNLTSEWGRLRRADTPGPGMWVTGPVTRTCFDVGLSGRGGVVGVKFRLGGTLAFARERPASIRDTTVPAAQWFPGIDEDLEVPQALPAAAEVLDRWLLARGPVVTDGYARVRRALALMADPAMTNLGRLAAGMAMSERSLQRLFLDHCGVGVKRILIKARVSDAVAALDRGWDGPLGDLANELGWFDQSHFTTDFLRHTGYRPAEYAAASTRQAPQTGAGRGEEVRL
ncbi:MULTISPECIES: helix-turn-helix transcriptional regulator [unclassified Brevibacterium]|uniref:helix-turn-helix transcriptional regulator n=1 Tax=unclassified Brevibacterium TaxID=2614124 RepID=UPI0010F77689|nr:MULTISPECIES: helix-turn-helix transcriptional regulator [unclassified Brevibacterium]MCM1013968.1 helix-turn-helix transcriptional regulator [Brevibacterium sp. XM4083]